MEWLKFHCKEYKIQSPGKKRRLTGAAGVLHHSGEID